MTFQYENSCCCHIIREPHQWHSCACSPCSSHHCYVDTFDTLDSVSPFPIFHALYWLYMCCYENMLSSINFLMMSTPGLSKTMESRWKDLWSSVQLWEVKVQPAASCCPALQGPLLRRSHRHQQKHQRQQQQQDWMNWHHWHHASKEKERGGPSWVQEIQRENENGEN